MAESRQEALLGLLRELDARELFSGDVDKDFVVGLLEAERFSDGGAMLRKVVDKALTIRRISENQAAEWYSLLPPPEGRREALQKVGTDLKLSTREADQLKGHLRSDIWNLAGAEHFLLALIEGREVAAKLSADEAERMRAIIANKTPAMAA